MTVRSSRLRGAAAIVAVGLLGVVAGWPGAFAGHQAAASYTGCLFISGKNKGKVVKLQVGDAPLSACTSKQVEIHLSGGDITNVTAGTGLSKTGGSSGDVTLDLAESYRLPQGCAPGGIAEWDGSDWLCGADDVGIPTSESGRLLSRLPFARTPVVDASFGTFHTSVTIGSDGLPALSYYDDTDDDLRVVHCGNAACTAGNTFSTVDSVGDVGQYNSIAIGKDGFPVISYLEDATPDALKVVHCTNVTCSTFDTPQVVDNSSNQVGWFTSITIGMDGFPVISYQDVSNSNLKVAHCTNETCSAKDLNVVDGATTAVGERSSITIGSDGLPIISYRDQTVGNLDLRVAHCGNTACSAPSTLTSIDTTGDVGHFTSIAIGPDGLAVVSYVDVTNGNLKVAHCSNIACSAATTQTVGPAGSVGTSVAIGADGLPVVSYAETGGGALKLAHCGNGDCSASNAIQVVDPSPVNARSPSVTTGTDNVPLIAYGDFTSGDVKVAHCSNVFCTPFHRAR